MNPFQAQYPLSRKKFWKKFLPAIIPSIFLSFILGLLATIATIWISETATFDIEHVTALTIFYAVVLTVLILAFYAWYFRVYIRTYSYSGDADFITIKKGVFTPTEIHVQYQKIQDVYVDQDLLDRILGIYDAHISSATVSSGIEAHIDGVDAHVAEGLKAFFLEKLRGKASEPSQVPVAEGMHGASVPAAQFSEAITDREYPIQGSWVFANMVGMVLMSLVVGLFGAGYTVAKTSKDGSGLEFLPVFLTITITYFILHLIGFFLWKSNYRFQFTPEYIYYRTGVLSLSERHLPYRSVQDVSVSQSLLDRMLGLSNVVIENAAQVAVQRGRSMNTKIKLVGMKRTQAEHIAEALKPIILSKSAAQTGV